MVWLTDKSPILQSNKPNKIETLQNQIYYYNGNAYLIPRGLVADGYTIPLGIDKTKRDIRPSNLHDIGCKYHELILINLPLYTITDRYIRYIEGKVICDDIPTQYLKVIPVKFNECNNLLYRAMDDLGIPKRICKLYRLAVNFNLNWLLTGKTHINLDNIYNHKLYT